MKMTYNTVKAHGEYLGFDEEKGFLYSVFRDYDNKGNKKYMIVHLTNGTVSPLIEYTGTC
ncbi:hypothetical protein C2I27_03885 [Priestia megaterium]|uniref:hypothetical protein n=1 Tax=Priestia megaterium TaxID=1404 RepID=UPI000D518CB8|nr:hypothetical protein [Priestia megaterium]PVC75037.1 hypothetical protein C2I27_03885 [Priestia megaterium]